MVDMMILLFVCGDQFWLQNWNINQSVTNAFRKENQYISFYASFAFNTCCGSVSSRVGNQLIFLDISS